MLQNVLITGAGSGIGRAITISLAKKNPEANFYLLGRNVDKLRDVASECDQVERFHVFPCDQGKLEDVKTAFAKIEQSLDAVICNAGIGGSNQYGANDRWQQLLDVNLSGTYYVAQESLPLLKKSTSEYRNILLVSSILARLGVPGHSGYCAAKAGMLGLMRSLAAEYAEDKILVNAICPGWVDTDMARQGIENFAQSVGVSYDKAYQDQMRVVPTHKMSSAEELGGLVEYILCSGQTSFTGQCFDINNGAIMP